MKRFLLVAPAVLLPLAGAGLAAAPMAGATVVGYKTITCTALAGNAFQGTGNLSGCNDKANTGGSGTLASGDNGTGTITWNGTGTTTLGSLKETPVSGSAACTSGGTEYKIKATVTGGTGAAANSIPTGGTAKATVCIDTSTGAYSLAPGTKFHIVPPKTTTS